MSSGKEILAGLGGGYLYAQILPLMLLVGIPAMLIGLGIGWLKVPVDWQGRTRQLIREERYQEAEVLIDAYLSRHSLCRDAFALKSQLHQAKGETQEAAVMVSRINEIDAAFVKSYEQNGSQTWSLNSPFRCADPYFDQYHK